MIGFSRRQMGGDVAPLSYPDFLDYRVGSRTFDGIAAYVINQFGLKAEGRSDVAYGMYTSSNLFDLLGLRPALGPLLPFGGRRTRRQCAGNRHRLQLLARSLWRRSKHRWQDRRSERQAFHHRRRLSARHPSRSVDRFTLRIVTNAFSSLRHETFPRIRSYILSRALRPGEV